MKTFLISIKIFLFFMLITGIIYPLIITGIAQAFFPFKANGSLIYRDKYLVGSQLIGQQFDSTIYFNSRPSAISYNPLPSGGSNIGLTNIKLKNHVTGRKNQFIAFNHLDSLSEVPSEMLFASASGLDPHISPEAALLQVDRICIARKFNALQKIKLKQKILNLTEAPQFLCFGEERLNVLLLNLELEKL